MMHERNARNVDVRILFCVLLKCVARRVVSTFGDIIKIFPENQQKTYVGISFLRAAKAMAAGAKRRKDYFHPRHRRINFID